MIHHSFLTLQSKKHQDGDLCLAVCPAEAAAHGWPPYGVRLVGFMRRRAGTCAPPFRSHRRTTVMNAKRPGAEIPRRAASCLFLDFMSLYRNVTICALVQGLSGLNVFALVPCVMFFDTAQRTAL